LGERGKTGTGRGNGAARDKLQDVKKLFLHRRGEDKGNNESKMEREVRVTKGKRFFKHQQGGRGGQSQLSGVGEGQKKRERGEKGGKTQCTGGVRKPGFW